jgi:hypothetical protein
MCCAQVFSWALTCTSHLRQDGQGGSQQVVPASLANWAGPPIEQQHEAVDQPLQATSRAEEVLKRRNNVCSLHVPVHAVGTGAI